MSYTREISIFCDKCGNWEQHSGRLGIILIRRKLKIYGWRHIKHQDFCPICAKDFTKRK